MERKLMLVLLILILLTLGLGTISYAGYCPKGGNHNYDYPYCCPCGNYYYGTGRCTKCGAKDTRSIYWVNDETAPTCTTNGIKRSGYQHDDESHNCITEEIIPALGHSYGGWSYIDDSQHVRTCTRDGCGYQDYASHSAGTGATCTSSAICSECGGAYGSALGHDWGAEHLYSSATCTDASVYVKECSRCSESEFSYGYALGHSYPGSYSQTSSIHYKNCTRCNTRLTSGNHYDNNEDGECDACGYVMIIYIDKPTATTTSFTYNGKEQSIVLSNFNENAMNISGNTAINAGNYTATVSLKNTAKYRWKDKSTDSLTFSWKINKATISNSNAPKGQTLIYNGYEQDGLSTRNGCIITGISKALHAGSYTAYVAPDSNHTWQDRTSNSRTINWVINKKVVSVIWKNTTFYYDETPKIPSAVATGAVPDTITISATGSQINPGTYTAEAVCAVSGNGNVNDYIFTNTSTSYTIKNGIIEGSVTITGTNMIGETLTAKLNITKPTSGTSVSYQWYSNTSNNTSGGTAINGATNKTYTIAKGLADKYIYLVATVSKQYYDTSMFKDITDSSNDTAIVSRKKLTIPTVNGTYTYTGAEQTVRLNNFDSATMIVSNNTRIDAGTQNVTVSLKDPANYQWSDKTTANKNISWIIETKKVAAVWGSKTTFTYNGKEQAPEVTADSGIPGETLNLTRTMQINAGTYTSVATIASVTGGRGKVSNYTLLNSNKEYVINKAECKITLNRDHLDLLKNQTKKVNYTYTGDGMLSVKVANTAIANATIDTFEKTVSVTGVTEGDTVVTVRGSEGRNYLATSAILTVTVHPSPIITSVKINNGAKTTKNVEVVMEISATNVSEIYVSNSNETPEVDAPEWIDYKLYTKHKLTWQNGAKTVYVWGKDDFDNMTVASTAGITLDARYSLNLKNNQKYLGRLESSSKYAIKADDGSWQWQDSSVFTNLVPITVYTFKTQLYDIVGITGESEELKLRAIYDNDGKLYIEYLN